MKILLLHNRYQFKGGEDTVFDAEKALLKENNHIVKTLEVDNSEILGFSSKVKAAINSIYSQQIKAKIQTEILQFKPEIVHVHNFFPLLSPSVYFACNEAGVPVVQTLHNYRLFCANASFYRDGQVCEDCLGKPFGFPAIVHKCYRGSSIGTVTVSAMSAVHRWMGTWRDRVNAYICLTEFAKQKFIQAGLPPDKIFVKSNFVHSVSQDYKKHETNCDPYALYVGRLSSEKGLEKLLAAWTKLDRRFNLKIVGNGPLAQSLAEKVKQYPDIELLGEQRPDAVYELMSGARFVIVPSEWYETFGLVVIEAFATGTPVIASRIGALEELVHHGYNGLQFEPGNVADLASQIDWSIMHRDELLQMGRNARTHFKFNYAAETNYQRLIDIYKQVAVK